MRRIHYYHCAACKHETPKTSTEVALNGEILCENCKKPIRVIEEPAHRHDGKSLLLS